MRAAPFLLVQIELAALGFDLVSNALISIPNGPCFSNNSVEMQGPFIMVSLKYLFQWPPSLLVY